MDGATSPAKRRRQYRVTSIALVAFVALLAYDGAGGHVVGVDSATYVASGAGGLALRVEAPRVSRAGLASPLRIEVARPAGFDGPVEVAITQHYLELWDVNGIVPVPEGEHTVGPDVVWTFEPPAGDALRIHYDARIEPAAQSGRSARVAVVDGSTVLAAVRFTTRVSP